VLTRSIFSSFPEVDGSPQRGSSLTLSWHHENLYFLHSTLPYDSSSIRNVSEGDLCSKTQYFMFAHCSIADIFKCEETTIRTNKQT
jgi:hypothetical protein